MIITNTRCFQPFSSQQRSPHNHRWIRSIKPQACSSKKWNNDPDSNDPKRETSLRDQIKRLDELFYSNTTTSPTESSASSNNNAQSVGFISDLPLWRVQWSVLPGQQEVLHVHVPHYVDLFNRLISPNSKRPWRFGHLYLPGGSASLSLDEYEMKPGSKAPLLGTLMEILQVVKFSDGRLLILAVGLDRFQVIKPRQAIPYSRADVMILPDEEEIMEFHNLDQLSEWEERIYQENFNDGTHVFDVGAVAWHSAACAASLIWSEYAVSASVVNEKHAVIDKHDDEEAAMAFGQRLIRLGGNEIVTMPYCNAQSTHESDTEGDGVAGMLLLDVSLAAAAAASHAMERVFSMYYIESDAEEEVFLQKQMYEYVKHRGYQINSVDERGVVKKEYDHGVDQGKESETYQPSLDSALQLESMIWREIDAISQLAHRISGRVAPLAEGLLCLRPERFLSDVKKKEGNNSQQHLSAHVEFPDLQRVKQLSFALVSMLGDVSHAEKRQEWLELMSITHRLREGLLALERHKKVLAAVVAMKEVDGQDDV